MNPLDVYNMQNWEYFRNREGTKEGLIRYEWETKETFAVLHDVQAESETHGFGWFWKHYGADDSCPDNGLDFFDDEHAAAESEHWFDTQGSAFADLEHYLS